MYYWQKEYPKWLRIWTRMGFISHIIAGNITVLVITKNDCILNVPDISIRKTMIIGELCEHSQAL